MPENINNFLLLRFLRQNFVEFNKVFRTHFCIKNNHWAVLFESWEFMIPLKKIWPGSGLKTNNCDIINSENK